MKILSHASAKKKTKRVSIFALLLLVFKRHYGGERVKRALPLSMAGTATSIIFVATNTPFVATKVCLSRQNFCRNNQVFVATECFCRDKTFVPINISSDKHVFLAIKVWSRQTYFCRNKHVCFFARKHVFCRETNMLVETELLLQQTHICRDKTFVTTKVWSRQNYVCRNQTFVATSILLSQQTRVCCEKTRLLSWQKYACRDKTFIATNMCLSLEIFVETKVLSRRIRVCCNKSSVSTCIILSRQAYFCRDKSRILS